MIDDRPTRKSSSSAGIQSRSRLDLKIQANAVPGLADYPVFGEVAGGLLAIRCEMPA
jgi:hypothetical protein